MSVIKDIYEMIKELKGLAEGIQNQEFASLVTDIQSKFFDVREEIENLKDDNKNLKEQIKILKDNSELEKDLELLNEGVYIRKTEKNDGKNIEYCPYCWNNHRILMPTTIFNNKFFICGNCDGKVFINRWKG